MITSPTKKKKKQQQQKQKPSSACSGFQIVPPET